MSAAPQAVFINLRPCYRVQQSLASEIPELHPELFDKERGSTGINGDQWGSMQISHPKASHLQSLGHNYGCPCARVQKLDKGTTTRFSTPPTKNLRHGMAQRLGIHVVNQGLFSGDIFGHSLAFSMHPTTSSFHTAGYVGSLRISDCITRAPQNHTEINDRK